MDLKDKIITLFENSSNAPYTFEELLELLNCEKEELSEQLYELKEQYIIHESKKHRFGLLKQFGLYIGTIDVKEKGFGFILSEDFENEFFVPRTETNHALNKDTVIFRITNENTQEKTEASVVKVIKRSLEYVVGKISETYFQKEFIPIDYKLNIFFEITDYGLSVENDIVKVKIDEFVNDSLVKCHVVEIIGNAYDVGIDVKSIAAKYDFHQEFSKEVINCLEEVVNDYNNFGEDEINKREFIDKKIITIDGKDAKDLDDAISIEILDNGNYLLGVYIADVSYFLSQNN